MLGAPAPSGAPPPGPGPRPGLALPLPPHGAVTAGQRVRPRGSADAGPRQQPHPSAPASCPPPPPPQGDRSEAAPPPPARLGRRRRRRGGGSRRGWVTPARGSRRCWDTADAGAEAGRGGAAPAGPLPAWSAARPAAVRAGRPLRTGEPAIALRPVEAGSAWTSFLLCRRKLGVPSCFR